MIDEPKPTWLFFPIDGFVVIDFDHGNFWLSLGPASALSLTDEFSLIFTDFLSGAKVHFGKEPEPFDSAWFHLHGAGPRSTAWIPFFISAMAESHGWRSVGRKDASLWDESPSLPL